MSVSVYESPEKEEQSIASGVWGSGGLGGNGASDAGCNSHRVHELSDLARLNPRQLETERERK